MVVHQPSYTWIGWFLGLIILGTIIATFGFTRNDLANPITSGAAATATLSAVKNGEQLNQLSFQATATAIAHSAELDRQKVLAAPTQTAVAQEIQRQRDAQDYERNSNLLIAVMCVVLVVIVLVVATIVYRSVSNDRMKISQVHAQLVDKQIALAKTEADRFEKEAVALRERRRNTEVAMSISQKNSVKAELKIQPGNGDGQIRLKDAA